MKDITLKNIAVTMYDRRDIARLFGISLKTVARAQRDGRMPSRKIGRSFYSRDDEVDEFFRLRRGSRY